MSRNIIKRVSIIVLALVLGLTSVTEVFAIPEGGRKFNGQVYDKYYSNGIRYYRPDCEGSSSYVVGGEAVISGVTAEEKVWSGLKSMGLTDEVTAGIMGNMAHEGNNFNPAQHEGSFLEEYGGSFDLGGNEGTSYGLGLIQWSFGRRIKIYNYVKDKSPGLVKYFDNPTKYSMANGSVYGVDGDKFIELADSEAEANALYSLELTFLVNEELKQNSSYSGVLDEKTVNGAADYFLEHVEIPADIPGTRPGRRQTANEMFSKYSGKTDFPGGSSGSGNGTGGLTTPAENNGSNVLWIGDSISVGAEKYIKNKWSEADAVVDDTMKDSKQFAGSVSGNPTGQELVKKYESEKRMRDVLVFALGTNNTGLTEQEVKDVLAEIKTPKTIIFVTNYNYSDENAYNKNNELIRKIPGMDSRAVVADWEEAVKGNASSYFDKGGDVHPNAAGSEYFVEVIARAAMTGYVNKRNSDCECEEEVKTGVWAGPKYNLTDGQVAGLLAVVKGENGENIEAMQTEATLMANLFEYKKPSAERTGDNLVDYVLHGGWFAKSTTKLYNESNTDYTKDEFNAVKDIWVNGNRTMPPEILEHDCIKCSAGIDHAYNDGEEFDVTDRSKYISGKTKLVQGSGGLSGSYIFYKFASDADRKGDPFGYFEDNPPSQTSSSTSTTAGAGVSWENGWISGGMDGYIKDAASSWGINLDKAAGKDFATTAGNGSGKGANKILLHSTETQGGFGDTVKAVFPESYSSADKENASRAPHFTVDMKNKKVYQHYSINKTSGAIADHDNIAGIQIEIFGYTGSATGHGEWNLRVAENFTEEDWDYLAKLIIAISEQTGAKLDGSGVDWTDDNKKLSVSDMKSYNGIMGHMHAADNDHADPKDIWQFLEPAIKRGGSGSGVCGGDTNGDLNATAIKLAWPEHGHDPDNPTEAYRQALLDPDGVGTRGEGDHCSITGKSCDAFVATVLRHSGVDKDVPCCGADNIRIYLRDSPKWEEVPNTQSSLKGGDVRASSGHVEMVVEINGELNIASASHCDRTGEIGGFYENSGEFQAFRFKGSRGGSAANSAVAP